MNFSLLAILILLSTTLPAFAADSSTASAQASKDAKAEAKAPEAKPAETKSVDTKAISVEATKKESNEKNATASTSNKSPKPLSAPVPSYSPNVTSSSKVEVKEQPVEKGPKLSSGATPAAASVKTTDMSTKASSDVPQTTKDNSQTKGNEPKTK